MNSSSSGDATVKFNLRFPPGMRDALQQAADESNRTLTQEIISRLESTLPDAVPMATLEPGGTANPYGLRLSPDLHGELKRHAEAPGHSLHAEVLSRLHLTLSRTPAEAKPTIATVADRTGTYPARHEVFDLVEKLSPKGKDALAQLLKDAG